MKKYFIFVLLFLLFNISVFAQNSSSEKTYKLKGTVENQNSEIIAGANLYFEKDGQTNVISTDINGEFKTELSAGEYKITVNEELSKDFAALVKMQDKGKNPKEIDFTVVTNSELENKYPKPIKLPYAAYPAAAAALGATGEVTVSIKIDKDGKVVSANSESGHPLLRQVSEKAALNSVFESCENIEICNAKLTYVFLNSKKENEKLRRYSNVYRIMHTAYP